MEVALPCPVYREIVQAYLHEGWYVLPEHLRNDPLKRGKHCFQPKHHDYREKYAAFLDERCFLLILWVHVDMVISAEFVQETVHFVSCDDVQYAVHKRQGKCVGDRDNVEFSIIDANPDLLVFLGHDNDGAEPGRPLHWAYEADF